MRVLAPGNGSVGWSKEFMCTGKGNEGSGCGAKLLVEEGDIWYVETYSWGEKEVYYTFVCPECGCMTDINVPGMVATNVSQRCRGMESLSYIRAESQRIKTLKLAR